MSVPATSYARVHAHSRRQGLGLLAAALCMAVLPHAAVAQTAAPSAAPLPIRIALEGNTLDKQPFKLEQTRGKVVLLMFWSTDCAVCRDKMRELRENVAGWAGQPFELVLVSLDTKMADLDAYEAIINKAVPAKQRFIQLWAKDPSYTDSLGTTQLRQSALPLAYVINKAGKPVKRYQGRIPAQAWDDIADLL